MRAIRGVLFMLSALAFTPSAGAAAVPYELQDVVQADMNHELIKPEAARWVFLVLNPYPSGGQIVCGTIDYQDSAKVYRGPHRFFSILFDGKVYKRGIEAPDTTLESFNFDYKTFCQTH